MYLTNQLFSNLSPKIDIISLGRYIEENLDYFTYSFEFLLKK